MYVRSRMTAKPFTVSPDATIAEALELMRQKQIRRIPVVKGERLVGIITERKLMEVSPSPATSLSVFEINYLLSKTKVSSVMTTEVVTVSSGSLLEEAALKMREYDVGGLPVVDNDKLVGIITETDLFDGFLEIMGFNEKGSRIAIEISEDKPGTLAIIAQVIAGFDLNITHLAVFRNELIVRVNTTNVNDLLVALQGKGFRVISVIRSEN